MRATTVTTSEMLAAGSWLPRDFLAEHGLSCERCGLTPANVTRARRKNPRTELLVKVGERDVGPTGTVRVPVYRCRNEESCAVRARRLAGERPAGSA